MKNFYGDPIFRETWRNHVAAFIARSGILTEIEARDEIKLIESRLGIGTVIANPEEYVTMVRVGGTNKLNRKEKKAIALIIANATEHADYSYRYVMKIPI